MYGWFFLCVLSSSTPNTARARTPHSGPRPAAPLLQHPLVGEAEPGQPARLPAALAGIGAGVDELRRTWCGCYATGDWTGGGRETSSAQTRSESKVSPSGDQHASS